MKNIKKIKYKSNNIRSCIGKEKIFNNFFASNNLPFAFCNLPFHVLQFALCILLFAFCHFSCAQTKISLEQAIETALKNNNSIKNEKLKADYSKALISTSTDIPKTNIFGEFGQINSNQNDTKFGISQSFALPTVYKRQKQVLKEDYNSKVLQINLKEFEIKKTVTH